MNLRTNTVDLDKGIGSLLATLAINTMFAKENKPCVFA